MLIGQRKVLLPINQNFRNNLYGWLFIFLLKKQQQQYSAQQNLQQEGMHMTFVKLHVHIKHDACTVQFQTWHIHCSISAQIELVITNHIKEFYYSFDKNQ